ncbi:ParB/RepB/Spo0J family partition protein [Patescibacteria group bacterium]|nr:ParB/RepB/Spo0J family partition protein [Patescibacteria group bacterium]
MANNKNKVGLGRGLSSLIPSELASPSKDEVSQKASPRQISSLPSGAPKEIDIKKIRVNPYQPRKIFAAGPLEELAASIREHGILQPLIVSEISPEEFELLAGERRLQAAKKAGLLEVPVVIRTVTDQEKLELALIENIQRRDLNPLEEALAYQKLMEEFSLTQEKMAIRVGKKRATISNVMRLLALPQAIQEALLAEKISGGHAKVIAGLKEERDQLKLLEEILNFGLSVRDAERSIKKISSNGPSRPAVFKSPEVVGLEEKLQSGLGTKAMIKPKQKGGEITLEFYSPEDLHELITRILK